MRIGMGNRTRQMLVTIIAVEVNCCLCAKLVGINSTGNFR